MALPVKEQDHTEPDTAPAPITRVSLLGVAAVCLAGGLALAAGLSLHRAALEQSAIEASAQSAARYISQAADREIAASVARLQALATSPALRAGDARAFYDQLVATPKPDGTWFVLWNAEQQVMNTLRPFGSQSLPRLTDFGPGTQATLHRIMRTRQTEVSPVVWGVAAQAHVIGVTIPVVVDGHVTHLFDHILSDRRIGQVINDQQMDLRWRGALIDRYGATVASVHVAARPPGPGVPAHWMNRLRGSQAQGTFTGERDGQAMLVAFARSQKSDWTAVVEVPRSIVTAPVETTVGWLLEGGALLVLASGFVAWLVADRADRPFQALRSAAAQARSYQREAEARYQTYWRHSHEALFALRVAPDGCFVFERVNPAFERMSGLSGMPVLGRMPCDCLPRETAERMVERGRQCIADGTAIRYEEPLDLPVGRRVWETSLVLLRDPGAGEIVRILGSARDVTDRRESEAALRGLGSRLLTLQDDERRKIARELHDSTAQILVGASFAVARVRAVSPGVPKEGDDAIEEALALIEESQREIRTLAYLLHPPLLDEMGLPTALRWYATGFARRSGMQVTVEIESDLESRRLPRDIESAFFRILQEAIGNAYRHSGGTEVRIALHWNASDLSVNQRQAVVLTVRDNGRGIAVMPSRLHAGDPALFGVGLVGMRERMLQLGGRLTVRAAEHGGTLIEAAVVIATNVESETPDRASIGMACNITEPASRRPSPSSRHPHATVPSSHAG